MKISLIATACLFALGCSPATSRPNLTPSHACRDGGTVGTSAVPGPAVIDAKVFAEVATPETVANLSRALDALLVAVEMPAAQGPLAIDATPFAEVTTPENVADIARALDALLQASQGCSSGRVREHA